MSRSHAPRAALLGASLFATLLAAAPQAHADWFWLAYPLPSLSGLGVPSTNGNPVQPFPGGQSAGNNPSVLSGYGAAFTASGQAHAVLWQSNAPGYVTDMHPAGYRTSAIVSVSGSQQVGYASTSCLWPCTSAPHAGLWTSGGKFVDLHPKSGFLQSMAQGTDGTAEVGWGKDSRGLLQPLFWAGTAAGVSAMALPAGFTGGAAGAIANGVAAGYGSDANGATHALEWSGPFYATVTDLNRSSMAASIAVASAGGQAGGSYSGISTGGAWHAGVWTTPTSFFDIHPGVQSSGGPYGYSSSQVYTMARVDGVTPTPPGFPGPGFQAIWLAGTAIDTATGQPHAILWQGLNQTPIDLNRHLDLGADAVGSVALGIDSTGRVFGAVKFSNGVWAAIEWESTYW